MRAQTIQFNYTNGDHIIAAIGTPLFHYAILFIKIKSQDSFFFPYVDNQVQVIDKCQGLCQENRHQSNEKKNTSNMDANE